MSSLKDVEDDRFGDDEVGVCQSCGAWFMSDWRPDFCSDECEREFLASQLEEALDE